MTAAEIIETIKILPPSERAEVERFVRGKPAGRKLSPDEITDLARKMVATKDPKRSKAIEDEIVAGFYGQE